MASNRNRPQGVPTASGPPDQFPRLPVGYGYGGALRTGRFDLEPPLPRAVLRDLSVALRHPHLAGMIVEAEDRSSAIPDLQVDAGTNAALSESASLREVRGPLTVQQDDGCASHTDGVQRDSPVVPRRDQDQPLARHEGTPLTWRPAR